MVNWEFLLETIRLTSKVY